MLFIFSILAKTIRWFIRTFNKGSGYTLPGYLILKLYPNILSSVYIKYPKGIVFVSGTNGKTTTSKLVSHLLGSFGNSVTGNVSGANLLGGLVSTILLDTTWYGKPRGDVGVFEIDEFTLPLVLKNISPTVLVLLNLSRDQLDRYGETDIIFDRWKESVSLLQPATKLVMDVDQKEFHEIQKSFQGHSFFFDNDPSSLARTKLYGSFNAKNINAAVTAVSLLGYAKESVLNGLSDFTVAYGRGETLISNGKNYNLFLAKNPSSFNHNLTLLTSDVFRGHAILFLLNDKIPDGRDVSWFYDIDPELIKSSCEDHIVYVGGSRALDFAVRLSYAGIEVPEKNIDTSLSNILANISDKDVVVFPNYSAMLEFRTAVLGHAIL